MQMRMGLRSALVAVLFVFGACGILWAGTESGVIAIAEEVETDEYLDEEYDEAEEADEDDSEMEDEEEMEDDDE